MAVYHEVKPGLIRQAKGSKFVHASRRTYNIVVLDFHPKLSPRRETGLLYRATGQCSCSARLRAVRKDLAGSYLPIRPGQPTVSREKEKRYGRSLVILA